MASGLKSDDSKLDGWNSPRNAMLAASQSDMDWRWALFLLDTAGCWSLQPDAARPKVDRSDIICIFYQYIYAYIYSLYIYTQIIQIIACFYGKTKSR